MSECADTESTCSTSISCNVSKFRSFNSILFICINMLFRKLWFRRPRHVLLPLASPIPKSLWVAPEISISLFYVSFGDEFWFETPFNHRPKWLNRVELWRVGWQELDFDVVELTIAAHRKCAMWFLIVKNDLGLLFLSCSDKVSRMPEMKLRKSSLFVVLNCLNNGRSIAAPIAP